MVCPGQCGGYVYGKDNSVKKKYKRLSRNTKQDNIQKDTRRTRRSKRSKRSKRSRDARVRRHIRETKRARHFKR